MKIKVIFFDFDGVLGAYKNEVYPICELVNKKTGIDFDKLVDCYFRNADESWAGKTSYSEFWAKFCRCIGHDVDVSLAQQTFEKVPLNQPMFNLAEKLKGNGYQIGIITNNTKERFGIIKNTYHLEKMFHPIIVSAEVGCVKGGGEYDGETIFIKALKTANAEPRESVFIDNRLDYLDIPNKMGIHTIHHDDARIGDLSAIVRELERLGVSVN